MASPSLFAVLLRRCRQTVPGSMSCLEHRCGLIYMYRGVSSSGAPANDRVDFTKEYEEPSSLPDAAPDDLRGRIFRIRFPKRSATAVIEKWVAEGRNTKASELRQIAKDLRRSQRYKHALELTEWMRSHLEDELLDGDHAMRIDLITKVFGVSSAEEFFEGLPSTAKSCEAYTALLHSYAGAKLVDKAESLFEKMKDSNLSVGILAYNEMMTLYTSIGQLDKVHVVVDEIKRRKVSPDIYTYNQWVSACAATLDIKGVRKILDEMASDSRSINGLTVYTKLAEIYISAGHFISSDNSLVETDKITQREWITYDFLILLHAGLGNIQKVNEMWKAFHMTSQKMTSRNYICILSAYLVLGKSKEADEVISEWRESKALDFDTSACNRLFDAFVKAGLFDEADALRELLVEKNCAIPDRFPKLPI